MLLRWFEGALVWSKGFLVADQIPNSTSEFSEVYDGPAIADHTMEVRDLAPALLALAQTFERANSLLNDERVHLSLEIKASPRQGSLDIMFVIKQTIEAAQGVLSSDFVTSALTLQTLLIGGGAGGLSLIGLLKLLKGKKPEVIETGAEAVTLETESGRLVVPIKLFQISNDGLIRHFLEAALKPLARPGIDKVEFRSDNQTISQIEKGEIDSFRTEDTSPSVTKTLLHTFLKVRLPKLDGAGKWQFHDGAKANWYEIQDAAFQNEVTNRTRAFRAGDILECDVEVTQTRSETGGLTSEYAITQVYDQRSYPPSGGEQQVLTEPSESTG
ncbi:MAG: hypothetical protein GEU75_08545 [Dehalococcoidia bacterium]|nr:hypothetical protein [Dehalococcoidia bacterium]